MKKLYYELWIDAIVQLQKQPKYEGNWKFIFLFYVSFFMALNWGIIYIVVASYFNIYIHNLFEIDFFEGNILNYGFSSFLFFMLPPLVLNYFFIFYNKKYQFIIEKYKFHNGKYFLWYMLISAGIPLFYVLIFM